MSKIFIVLLALAAFTAAAEITKEEGVLVLNKDNFDDAIRENSKILVEFYAPWCGHCKKLAPEYAKAAEILSADNPPIALAKVDATENEKLAEIFEVQGFPTIKWFVDGVPQEYQGGRTVDEIVNWVRKKSGPPSTEITDNKLEELKKSQKFIVVYFGSTDAEEFKTYEQIASVDDKHSYYHVTSSSNLPSGLTTPGVAIFRQFDEPIVVFKGKFERDTLNAFISRSFVPTIVEFSEEYIEPIFQEQKPALFLFINKADEEHKKILSTFEKAAYAGKDRIFFSYSGATEGIQQRLADFVGATEAELPKLMIIAFSNDGVDKYVYDGDVKSLTVDDVDKFLTKLERNELTKFLKTEEIPATNDEPVKVVVGKSFNQFVGGDNDVLLEFYAPWCGHCKALEPKYTELATELKNVKGLVIAKCDSTANEIDGIQIQGFPTIKFFPKGKTTAIEYEGEREVEAFKTYLAEHSESYKSFLASKEDL